MKKNSDAELLLKRHGIPVNELKDPYTPMYDLHKERIRILYRNGELSENEVRMIECLAPHLSGVLNHTSNAAAQSQGAAFNAHTSTATAAIKSQEYIAGLVASDEARLEIAEKLKQMNKDNNSSQERMNKDNNEFFKSIAFLAAGVGCLFFVARNADNIGNLFSNTGSSVKKLE